MFWASIILTLQDLQQDSREKKVNYIHVLSATEQCSTVQIYVNVRDDVYSEFLDFAVPLCTCMDKAEVFESLGMPNFLTQKHT